MMAEKTRTFGDRAMVPRILNAGSPKTAKQLGPEVSFFEESIWKRKRIDIVVRGNKAKFRQNKYLKRYLLGTATQVLAEARPHDTIWGIGLSPTDIRAQDPFQWQGQNLLGFALMRVRAALS